MEMPFNNSVRSFIELYTVLYTLRQPPHVQLDEIGMTGI
jgi:hypothetical protein